MAWIESHQTLGRHPKLLRLASELQIDKTQAIGHLSYLWWWALDFAPAGDLSSFSSAEVAGAAEYRGDPARFWDSMQTAVWIDPDGMLHDWLEYAGAWISAKARQKRYRDKQAENKQTKPPNVIVTQLQRNGDVTMTTDLTQPNITKQYQTVPIKKEARFTRPSPQEVIEYGKQIRYNDVDGQQFCDFYESKGWRVGTTPMKDWKAAVRTWKKRGGSFGPKGGMMSGPAKGEVRVGATGGFQQTKQSII